MIIIKKYPNRRLYNTEISKCVTQEDVRQLVLDGVEFCVKDAKTDEDLTRSVLLQIITEQEHDDQPMFNTPMLTQIIRFYGNACQSAFSDYMQKSLELFASQQENIQRQFQQAVDSNPFAVGAAAMTQQNMEAWRHLQDSFFKAAGFPSAGDKPGNSE